MASRCAYPFCGRVWARRILDAPNRCAQDTAMSNPQTLGERVAYLRALADPPMSPAELARVSGLSTRHIELIERGKIKMPQPDTIRTLAFALGCQAVYLRRGLGVASERRVRSHLSAARQRFAECQRVLRGEVRDEA